MSGRSIIPVTSNVTLRRYTRSMIWKLIALAALVLGGLWYAGYRPADLERAADSVSRTNAAGISPDRRAPGDWGL